MNTKRVKEKKGQKNNRSQSSTVSFNKNQSQTFNNVAVEKNSNTDKDILYKAILDIAEIKKQILKLEENEKTTVRELSSIQKSEKKLLNRFGWTLIMSNILIGTLAAVIIATTITLFYPYLKMLEKSNEGLFWVIITILGLILTGIIGLWWTIEKFALYVKNRDTNKYKTKK